MATAQSEGPSLARVTKVKSHDHYSLNSLFRELGLTDKKRFQSYLKEHVKSYTGKIDGSAKYFLESFEIQFDPSNPSRPKLFAGEHFFGQGSTKWRYSEHQASIIDVVSQILKTQEKCVRNNKRKRGQSNYVASRDASIGGSRKSARFSTAIAKSSTSTSVTNPNTSKALVTLEQDIETLQKAVKSLEVKLEEQKREINDAAALGLELVEVRGIAWGNRNELKPRLQGDFMEESVIDRLLENPVFQRRFFGKGAEERRRDQNGFFISDESIKSDVNA